MRAKEAKKPKGSVYIIVRSPGPEYSQVFQAQQRNITFESYNDLQDVSYWLESYDRTTDFIGYFDIMVDIIQEGSMSCPVLAGVFVLKGFSLTTVAEDLRRRFGPRTALFKEAQ